MRRSAILYKVVKVQGARHNKLHPLMHLQMVRRRNAPSQHQITRPQSSPKIKIIRHQLLHQNRTYQVQARGIKMQLQLARNKEIRLKVGTIDIQIVFNKSNHHL